jgi:PAS domain S-box-containing protein
MKRKGDDIISSFSPTETILESISDGVFTVDMNWRVTSFNRAAERITGVSRKEALGRLCSEVFRSSLCGASCALRETLKSGKPIIGKTCYIVNAEGRRIPISISTATLRDSEGRLLGGAETFRDLSELEALRMELRGKHHLGDLASRSPLMQRVFEVLPAIASSPSSVLILGETGSGKELVARALHSLSPRSKGPFVAVNCGALPDTLLESELFGYRAGAFTGASKNKPGRFALAKGGSLFLDEIGDVSPALQIRLLRVLQERVYEPLGATRGVRTDARLIFATNRDLTELMRQGKFREDLYYRVNVVRVELPPLRRRKEDIPMLVDQFITRFNRLHGKSLQGISNEALSLLMARDWPGNIRELENAIERAFITCDQGLIGARHLAEYVNAPSGGGAKSDSSASNQAISSKGELRIAPDSPHTGPVSDIRQAHRILDAAVLRGALERNHQNRQAAANELGIHKTTLFRRMKKLGIPFPSKDGRNR